MEAEAAMMLFLPPGEERLADRARVLVRPAPGESGSDPCFCLDSVWSVSPRLVHRHTSTPHGACALCVLCRSRAGHGRRTRRAGSPTSTRRGCQGPGPVHHPPGRYTIHMPEVMMTR